LPRLARDRPRSRFRTFVVGCGLGCAVVVVALFVVLGILYSRATAIPASVRARSEPASAQQDTPSAPGGAELVPSVEEQTHQIQRTIESGQAAQVALRVSEAELNRLVAEGGGSSGEIRDLHVVLQGDHLSVAGLTRWAGRQVYLTAQLTPQASNGRLGLRVDSVWAGNLGLPGSVVSRIQADVDRAMANHQFVDERVHIDDAAVSGGELVISGHTRGR
jgi:hypothetical protein